MNLSFYTAAVGAEQQQRRLDVHANNIANVNTFGFRAEKPSFSSLMQDFFAGANDELLWRGTGSFLATTETDFRGTGVVDTGRAQDYAIQGDGFFALWDPATGAYSYTRDGSFSVAGFQRENDRGELETKWYLSDGGGRFVVGKDGDMIEVEDPQASQPVGVFDFINKNGMQHVGGNRFVPVEKNGQLQVGEGLVLQGCLESSNADLANELAKVIESQRSFSYVLKMVQTSDELETTVNNLR